VVQCKGEKPLIFFHCMPLIFIYRFYIWRIWRCRYYFDNVLSVSRTYHLSPKKLGSDGCHGSVSIIPSLTQDTYQFDSQIATLIARIGMSQSTFVLLLLTLNNAFTSTGAEYVFGKPFKNVLY
jgi:hypothetical protein